MVNRHKAEVDVSEFWDGLHLRLDMDGMAKLEDKLGEAVWVNRLLIGLSTVSANRIMDLCGVGLRDDQGKLVAIPGDPAGTLADLARKCQDAWCLAVHGKPFEEWNAEIEAAQKKAATENPQNGAGA